MCSIRACVVIGVAVRAVFAAFCAVAVASSAAAQTASEPVVNNLVHPAGTATCKLGELGRVDAVGTGATPMVLIPGAPFGGEIWAGFMERNAGRYTMLAVTPPGYGGTPPPPMPEPAAYHKMAWSKALCDAIVGLIRERKLDRPVLVGHHLMGDYYALRIALDHPELVRGVVIVAGKPSMAMPAPDNAAGQTPRYADARQRRRQVQTMMVPFYQTVSAQTWRSGSLSAATLSRDAERGAALFERQVAVPMATQIRYFLEYQMADLAPELGGLKPPLRVIVPDSGPITLSQQLELNREMNIAFFGDMARATDYWTKQLTQTWGSVEEGLRRSMDLAAQWEYAMPAARLDLVKIPDCAAFIMDDQPERLDAAVAELTARVADAPAGGR